MRFVVIGAGGWGTTLANLLAETNEVSLWIRDPELLQKIQQDRENKKFLPGISLSPTLDLTNDKHIAEKAECVVFAVPSQFMRTTAESFAPVISKNAIVVSIAKGLELGTYKRMSQVLKETLKTSRIAALSGPNHCEEVARKIPTATVIASKEKAILEQLKQAIERSYFKVYPHDDLIGVEICGSIKNIVAIASGIAVGLGLGDNAQGAIITYGLTEMNKFGRYFGSKQKTIYGLAGVGDLIATCTSEHSRNRRTGKMLAQGKSMPDIIRSMEGQVAEGITTAKAVYEFSKEQDIDLPLTSQVYKVLYEKKELKKAIADLLNLI